MKKTISLILLIFASFQLKAQLNTQIAYLPFFIDQGILLGPSYFVENVSYTGHNYAIGYFTTQGTHFGIDQGIVITTGSIFKENNGPQGPNNKGTASFNNGSTGSTFLETKFLSELGGNLTYNSAILEFDFIPEIDSLTLEYVFGSDEYPEFSTSNYKDFFAIFISGPGIIGSENIAKLINGNNVFITNVNNGVTNNGPCVDCAEYVNNGDGSNTSNQYFSDEYIQYDGYTTVLKAKKNNLQIGESYHLMIAISDVGDRIYDSGVFLKTFEQESMGIPQFEKDGEVNFSIQPNPVQDAANLNLTFSKASKMSYTIMDALGNVILSQKEELFNKGKYGLKLNFTDQHLDSGVYFLQIIVDGNQYTKKIILQ